MRTSIYINAFFRDECEYKKEAHSKQLLTKIAGLDGEMQELQDILNVALGYVSPISGSMITRGVLLYGSSGTGKTSVANALAQYSKANVVSLSVANCYYRSAENSTDTLFENIIKHAPSVVIVDDIDILCPAKARGNGTERQIASCLLHLFDTIMESEQTKVMIIATSSKPDAIDPIFRK